MADAVPDGIFSGIWFFIARLAAAQRLQAIRYCSALWLYEFLQGCQRLPLYLEGDHDQPRRQRLRQMER
ncbi:MAG TPA: hypothetical protein VN222_15740, partial [Novosphingobium sp.]|nr:hypothetical protein [Novosphingobium sp.]